MVGDVPRQINCRVVLEVAADCREIELGFYASGSENTLRSDTAELQDLRGEDCTCGEDDFPLRRNGLAGGIAGRGKLERCW